MAYAIWGRVCRAVGRNSLNGAGDEPRCAVPCGGTSAGWIGASRCACRRRGSDSRGTQGTNALDEHYQRGKFLVDAGRYREAIPHFKQAVQNQSDNADAFNYLRFAYQKLGETAIAFDYYQKTLAVEPEYRGANEYLGELYLQTDQLEKAEHSFASLKRSVLQDVTNWAISKTPSSATRLRAQGYQKAERTRWRQAIGRRCFA